MLQIMVLKLKKRELQKGKILLVTIKLIAYQEGTKALIKVEDDGEE